MNRNELEKKEYWELIDICIDNISNFTYYDKLKELAMEQVENDNLSVAIDILSCLHLNPSEYYLYDYSKGIMESPKPIEEKEELIELILKHEGEKLESIIESNILEEVYSGKYVKDNFEKFEKCVAIDCQAPSFIRMKKEYIEDNEYYIVRFDLATQRLILVQCLKEFLGL